MFLYELKKFSRQNWWVYLLLIIASIIVMITWKWNIVEILILFFANLLWNLFIMVMQANYTKLKNNIWAVYQLLSSVVFASIAIYSFIKFEQYQYIIWQISYTLAAISSISFFTFNKNIKFLNSLSMWALNIVLFWLFLFVWLTNFAWIEINLWFSSILMAIWFSLVTTGLVSKNNDFKYCYHNMCIELKTNDKFRYWLNLFWIIWIILGSIIWVIKSYLWWSINWIDLWYFILTLTVFVFYLKLLPKYIK